MTIKENVEHAMDSVAAKGAAFVTAGSMWTPYLDTGTKALGAIYLIVMIVHITHKTWIAHVNNKKD